MDVNVEGDQSLILPSVCPEPDHLGAPAFGADNHHGSASPQQNARSHQGPHGGHHQNSHRDQHNTYYRSGSSYYHGVYRDPYVYAPPPVTYVPRRRRESVSSSPCSFVEQEEWRNAGNFLSHAYGTGLTPYSATTMLWDG